MRAAPPVAVSTGDAGLLRTLQSLLFALASSALAAWFLARAGQPAFWGLLAGLPAAALAWWRWPSAVVQLAWDGQQWQADGAPVQVAVALDLGFWLLLRARPDSPPTRTRWLPVALRLLGGQQHLLRAALYSRAPEAPHAPAQPSSGSAAAPD